MTELKERAHRMTACLEEALKPELLQLRDDSKRHARHAGRQGIEGDETHFTLTIVSTQFSGLSPVARHRMVNALLAKEFESGMHSLSLTLTAPGEK
ncbi:BolA family protein [Swaminathania salitolerans]|uniref:BolA family transcriptional regulator n=1 Tax=Swaminathania salitolerans TaxID=182838 RepID=A0A511BP83_9PROT|nr:BolA family protein [Swaminathania salitolerans]GBQ10672.1 stress response and cell division protein BolA [Swaminathania salitolerans LMG 21291]GEL02127.1 BolA family transcriptional regulator [Swaminathania salitolerans]